VGGTAQSEIPSGLAVQLFYVVMIKCVRSITKKSKNGIKTSLLTVRGSSRQNSSTHSPKIHVTFIIVYFSNVLVSVFFSSRYNQNM
jgi:hypothetical protein